MSDDLQQYTVDPTWGCWTWTGDVNSNGYGVVWKPTPRTAHRAMFELHVGPVPDGFVLEHSCKNRRCVRPLHLEPVTQRENLLRRSWRYLCLIKRCPKGHSMEHAIVTEWGGRLCRACASEARAR